MQSTNKKVAYFTSCTENYFESEIGKAAVDVLQKNDVQIILPKNRCCSIARLYNSSERSFIKHAKSNVRSLFETTCDIVTTCSSCAHTLKHEYPNRLKSRQAETVSKHTYGVMEYLFQLMQKRELKIDFKPVKQNFLYHAPCHLKLLGQEQIDNQIELLKLIPGISIKQIKKGCCGMGGTFGMKQKNFAQSMKIGTPVFEEIRRTKPDMIVTECPGCKIQIAQGAGVRVIHPVMILKQAYGL